MNNKNTIEMMKREFFDLFSERDFDNFSNIEDNNIWSLDYIVIDHVIFGYDLTFFELSGTKKYKELIYKDIDLNISSTTKQRNKKLIQFLFHNRELIKFWKL